MNVTSTTANGFQTITINCDPDYPESVKPLAQAVKAELAHRLHQAGVKATLSTKFRKNRVIITIKFKSLEEQAKLEALDA